MINNKLCRRRQQKLWENPHFLLLTESISLWLTGFCKIGGLLTGVSGQINRFMNVLLLTLWKGICKR